MYLIFVVVFPVDHHGLESVSPENLVGEVGGHGVEEIGRAGGGGEGWWGGVG